ncbi:MAG: hypothetical protein A2776_02845 [Candidatus Levybacteria bacterium RIFCSPHIGHO2_01_FULL_40_10]|nr:MAG: hypothetical protein A2776_02845 [Candidatus Levybacteria bacterium RIFCSPHIGHO2_01_FULL_40_10]
MRTIDSIYKNKKQIFINNLIGGLAWAIGATVGLAIIVAALGFIVSNANVVPIVGDFIVEINEYVIKKSPRFY